MNTHHTLEVLRRSLQSSVDALDRRQASDIAESLLDDYLRLDWLEWHGGTLRLTTVGRNICSQEMIKLRNTAAALKY